MYRKKLVIFTYGFAEGCSFFGKNSNALLRAGVGDRSQTSSNKRQLTSSGHKSNTQIQLYITLQNTILH